MTPAAEPVRFTINPALRTPVAIAGALGLLAVLFVCIAGPIIWGDAAGRFNLDALAQPPSAAHPLGTDALGRDILDRVLVAGRLSVALAALATALGSVGGVILGALPAVAGPRLHRLLSAIINGSVAFPGLLLALFMDVIFGLGIRGATLALAVATIPPFARLTHTLAARVAGSDYLAATRMAGVRRWRLLLFHVVPNIAEPILVNATISVGGTLLAFSGLSFLGLGIQPPGYDWGRLLNEGLARLYISPMAALAPGIAILLTGLSFQLAGEALAAVVSKQGRGRSSRRPHRTLDALEEDQRPTASTLATEPGILLEVLNLSVTFESDAGISWPVREVSLRVQRAEVIGLVGESGSGKSLTALTIARLTPAGAQVRAQRLAFNGHDLLSSDVNATERVLGTGIAFVPQDPLSSLNPALRIDRQLTEAVEVHKGTDRSQARTQAETMLLAVRISAPAARMRQYPHELSGGMRQRVIIAMGLMIRPQLIIADEPTTSLDVTVQREVLARLKTLAVEADTAVILISHDIALISQNCQRIIVMYGGRMVEEVLSSGLANAVHPYTRLLLATVPDMSVDRSQPLATIAGRPADPHDLTLGCPFVSRCARALDRCSHEFPTRTSRAAGHWVACWNPSVPEAKSIR